LRAYPGWIFQIHAQLTSKFNTRKWSEKNWAYSKNEKAKYPDIKQNTKKFYRRLDKVT